MPSKGFTHESTYNESKEWYTPREIFQALNIDFDLDPCSPGQDIVRWVPAQIHYTIEDDGLNKEWFGNVFMNPPYGNDTPIWLDKLSKYGNGIALVFARPDTKWFQKYVPLADAICFIESRIHFIPQCQALFYADGIWNPKTDTYIDPNTGEVKKSRPGAASMLVAYGKENAEALFQSGLGLTLPVSKHTKMFRTESDFAGGSRCPSMREVEAETKARVTKRKSFNDENLSRNVEHRQSILDVIRTGK